MGLEPGLEGYLQRLPFVDNLALIDKDGNELEFSVVTSPNALYFQTAIGEFGIVFQDLRTISIGLPADQAAGLRFQVRPVFWHISDFGGELKSIRNFGYNSNGEIIENHISPQNGTHQVELIGSNDSSFPNPFRHLRD